MSTEYGMPGGRRAGQVLLCLVMACALVFAGTSGASAAAKKRTVSLKVSSSSVVTGTKITLSGAVTKSPKGTKVRIEQLKGRTWKTLKTLKTTSSKGKFKTSLRATSTASYRAVAPKTRKLKVATSKVRKVRVRVPVPATAPPVAPPPAPAAPPAPTKRTTKVSRGFNGAELNDAAQQAAVSENGQYVVYQSSASNIVPDDNNSAMDVFSWDRLTNETTLISQTRDDRTASISANGSSVTPAMSADGRYIAYSSDATDLVGGDENGKLDVFLWDRVEGDTIKVTQTPDGDGANGHSTNPSISTTGLYITYQSEATNISSQDSDPDTDVYVWNRSSDSKVVSRTANNNSAPSANNQSVDPVISGDGNYVAYSSTATNLVGGDSADGEFDVFVTDLKSSAANATAKVSQTAAGTDGESLDPSISGDGRYITFSSKARNPLAGDGNGLADVFVWDRLTTATKRLTPAAQGVQSLLPAISADGRHVAYATLSFSQDDEEVTNVLVTDWQTGATTEVPPASTGAAKDGNSYRPSISTDGRYIVYQSVMAAYDAGAENPTDDIFVWDRQGTL